MDSPLALIEQRVVDNDTESTPQEIIPAPVTSSAACFLRGTCIATLDGDRSVETLSAGDLLYNVTGNAVRVRSARWRAGSQSRLGDRSVRLHAGSLGANLPSRDLVLRGDHAIHLAGANVPLAALVNGRSIVWEPVPSLSFWDVETENDAVLLAENVPVASRLHRASEPSHATRTVTAIDRAAPEPKARSRSDAPHLVVADRTIRGVVDGQGRHVFQLPPRGDISITNRSPHSIGRLQIQDEHGVCEVPLDDPALRSGQVGGMQLPRRYLDGCAGAIQLVVTQAA